MSNPLPEFEPGCGDSTEWRKFICYEMPDGHTFDPISYLCLCWKTDEVPQDPRYETWEELYLDESSTAARHLISVAEKIGDSDPLTREAAVQSALRIGSTLNKEHCGYGSYADIFESAFWFYFERGDFDRLESFSDGFQYCSQESAHYMREAMIDPLDYTLRLIIRDTN